MLSNIDEFGLNGFDRRHWKGGKGGFIDVLYYQSSNEKDFLLSAKALGQLPKIKRGTVIEYEFEGERKRYLPDYILDDKILFEIKSKWTMFGKDNEYLPQNVVKLQAAKEHGYEVFVVIDGNTVSLDTFLGSIHS